MAERCSWCGFTTGHAEGCGYPESLGGRIAAIEAEARKLGVDVSAQVRRIRDRTTKELRRAWRNTDR